jgi:hypothetical protein
VTAKKKRHALYLVRGRHGIAKWDYKQAKPSFYSFFTLANLSILKSIIGGATHVRSPYVQENGEVGHFQVTLKVGFKIKES